MTNQRYPRPPVKGPVVIPNGMSVKFNYTYAGQRISNVMHGTITTGPVNPTIAETIMQNLLSSAGFTTWMTHIHPSCIFTGVWCKDLRSPYQPTLTNSTLTSHPGTSTGTEMSSNAALVMTLHTAQSGKGFFGRQYLAGITQDNLADARHWATTLNAPAMGYINAIFSAMLAGGVTWGVGQRALQANTTPGAPPNLAVARAASIIPGTNASLTDFRVDSQRRRLGKN